MDNQTSRENTNDRIEAIYKRIVELSKKTRYSVDEIIEALEIMVSVGATVEETCNVMRASLEILKPKAGENG